jgi:hypothetical protein
MLAQFTMHSATKVQPLSSARLRKRWLVAGANSESAAAVTTVTFSHHEEPIDIGRPKVMRQKDSRKESVVAFAVAFLC